MSTSSEKVVEALRASLTETERLRCENRRMVDAAHEPIAIVAMSCRYPGGIQSPEDLWEFVVGEGDAVSGFPTNRGWDLENLTARQQPGDEMLDTSSPGGNYVHEAAFVPDVDEFDAAFFGISPREALAMDPQQRLLLEASWETLERAGIDPVTLKGSPTGVYIGATQPSYGQGSAEAVEGAEGHLVTGSVASVISGRLAYTFGFEGPAVTIDTACSSSLVAVHLAVRALRQDECSLALAGGVTVMATPGLFVGFSAQGVMAFSGRCKAFAASADGTSFSEGVGLLLLERLSDAQRAGHQVLAVIRGTAANQDGASNGLTAPSGRAQRRVIRQALADARLTADQVDAVEGHGTGTTLGDPIEANALIATYGQGRPDGQPLWLGSIKSNIGHAQAAAGVGGLIKMVMALQHGLLPKTLHIDAPSPHIDWSAGQVRLLLESRPWPSADRPGRAGVSSFGLSGTNAHAIVEQAPEHTRRGAPDESPAVTVGPLLPWVVSGKTETALRAQVARLQHFVEQHTGLPAVDVGWSLAASRSTFDHRAVVLGADRTALLTGLGQPTVEGTAQAKGKVVFVFPGQGSQWIGMAVELLQTSPVFGQALRACAEAVEAYVDWSVEDVLRGRPDAPSLERIEVVQPVLFAVMVALAALWRACGVEPAAVVGHSQGEIAAACVSGALSLEDAARLVVLRSQLFAEELVGSGAVASIALPREQVEAHLDGYADRLSIAGVNGPRSVTVAGEVGPLKQLVSRLEAQGARARMVPATVASHCAQVDRLRQSILDLLSFVNPAAGTIPVYSTVTGEVLDGPELDADYWFANCRRPVGFEPVLRRLLDDGFRGFIECSAHPVLTLGIEETAESVDTAVAVVGTLRRNEGGLERFYTSLAEAWTRGVAVHWSALFSGSGARTVNLPTYAFQRSSFWLKPETLQPEQTPQRASDEVDAWFWEAVDRQDLPSLAEALEVDHGQSLSELMPALASWRRRQRTKSTIDSWRYRVTWKPLTEGPAEPLAGTWLVIAPPRIAVTPTLVSGLTGRGAATVVVDITTEEVDRDVWANRIAEVTEALPRLTGVLSLLGLADRGAAAGTLVLVQSLADAGVEAPLWCLTRGAVAVGRSDPPAIPSQAQVWGLGRVVALEQPRSWGGLVDLPEVLNERAVDRLCRVLAGIGAEDQAAVRPMGVFGRRLVRAPLGERGSDSAWQPRGTVMVTGGTGGVGAHVARWLASQGAEHLVLTSRRGAQALGAGELYDELTTLGARVTLTACDAADRDQLAAVLQAVPADCPLTAVVHAVGVPQYTLAGETSVEDFHRLTEGKVAGAEHLDALLADADLDAFVLFSSNSGVWGASRHTAYAAANAHLDALAQQRRSRGLRATSIAWGAWGGAGMMELHGAGEYMRRRGVLDMAPPLALAAMAEAVAHDETFLAVADLDWARFVTGFTSERPSALLDDLPEVRHALSAPRDPAAAAVSPQQAPALVRRLNDAAEAERDTILLDLVRSQAATVLGHDTEAAVPPERAFREIGFDSLTVVELRNRLTAATGLRLGATVVFDHPNARSLARHLKQRLLGGVEAEPSGPTTFPAPTDEDPVVIVGMSCRLPGGIATPEDLWRVVAAGEDAVCDLPGDRGWYSDGPGPRGSDPADEDQKDQAVRPLRQAGMLAGVAEFDPGFFDIPAEEALVMDPQQRLLLETAWEAFERAGVNPRAMTDEPVGVYLGVGYQGFVPTGPLPEGSAGFLGGGIAPAIASGRVAYVLNLKGPTLTVDTGCSSSAVALHLAVRSLRQGECEMALAGGATVLSQPVAWHHLGGAAADGRCKPFSADADGTGWGEGVGMLLVERLSRARRLGHPVLAVVRGSAVNHHGASNGLTAPHGPSQQRLIHQALSDARLTADQVDAVEAHGTGTPLGDSIEAEALLATYGRRRPAGRPLKVGTVKSNIGHPQSASGITGVIKTVLSMRHGLLPRTLHIKEPTPQVDWSSGTVELLTESVSWPTTDAPRRAAVSSFGASGTQAHIILEQAPEAAPTAGEALIEVPDAVGEASKQPTGDPPAPEPHDPGDPPQASRNASPIDGAAVSPDADSRRLSPSRTTRSLAITETVPCPLTARSAAALRAQAGRLLAELETNSGWNPVDVGYSLATTRTAFEHRAVVLAGNRAELMDGLRALRRGDTPDRGVAATAAAESSQPLLVFSGVDYPRSPDGELYPAFPVFADAWDEVHAQVEVRLDGPAPPAVRSYAGELALFKLLRSWGLTPRAVLGHRLGHVTAAHAAGALPAGVAAALAIAWAGPPVSDASVDGLTSGAVKQADQRPEPTGVPCLTELRDILREVTPDTPRINLLSPLTGKPFEPQELAEPDHWIRQSGVPTASVMTPEGDAPVIELAAALTTGGSQVRGALAALSLAFAHGAEVDWVAVFGGSPAQRMDVPTYAFQRERYWLYGAHR